MKTIDDQELAAISGGDSFWQDLGQFTGGFVGCLTSDIPSVPNLPFYMSFVAGLVAATVN